YSVAFPPMSKVSKKCPKSPAGAERLPLWVVAKSVGGDSLSQSMAALTSMRGGSSPPGTDQKVLVGGRRHPWGMRHRVGVLDGRRHDQPQLVRGRLVRAAAPVSGSVVRGCR